MFVGTAPVVPLLEEAGGSTACHDPGLLAGLPKAFMWRV